MNSLAEIWASGRVAVIATLAEGPNAGYQVVCALKRQDLRAGVRKANWSRKWEDGHFMDSLRGAVRGQIMRGIAQLTPETDQNFMGDLAILISLKIASSDEGVLDRTGLFSLFLAVSEDATQPWTKRGFLSSGDAANAPVLEAR
jgi:hypothetical protein